MTDGIGRRKADHIELAARGDVGFERKTNLFECVNLVHEALSDLSADAVDTSVVMLGKPLRAPLIIAAMTGGTEQAGAINLELSAIAEARGYGFGLGSQRAMCLDASTRRTYCVRDVAPTALVLGNVGLAQARQMPVAEVRALVTDVGADALCIHLNPAMEIVQPGGDRDFSGGSQTLGRLTRELGIPVIVKETGCGLGFGTLRRLRDLGIDHVDVSGSGGTSWVAVEMHRSKGPNRTLAEALREWGIPTAASVAWAARVGFETVIATGGIGSGLDVAKAIALGADAAGVARPVLKALLSGGRSAAEKLLDAIERELKAVMFLVGARDVRALRAVPRVVTGELDAWMRQGIDPA